MVRTIKSKHLKYALIFKVVFVLGLTLTYVLIATVSREFSLRRDAVDANEALSQKEPQAPWGRSLKAVIAIRKENCTPPAIEEFPSDGFTREQRRQGFAVLHALLACYLFVLLAIVCDDYFVPAIKLMCNSLAMSEDVAGATFMAAASSSPELFINCVGTFVTQGDIGVGTIVGSAVFNVLAVPACCGLFASKVVQLDWWPVSRDSLMYGVSVISLILVLDDGIIEWWEALLLVSAYIFYISAMYFDQEIGNLSRRLLRRFQRRNKYREVTEIRPLLLTPNKCENHGATENGINGKQQFEPIEEDELDQSTELWQWPGKSMSACSKFYWVLTWPISFVLFCTTPDPRKNPRFVIITFFMCIFWIGTTSYMVAWLITVVGDTLDIPDSVMGLTFLAAGTSVTEAVASVIVTNQGHGSMGVSNSLGSNTFDILLCLGLPWLIKSSFYPKYPHQHYVIINSSGLGYSAISLFSSLILLYTSFLCNRFVLDWKIGLTCLLMYAAFLGVASVIELNLLFPVNLPTCDRTS